MKIDRASTTAVEHVALNMRDRDYAEFSAVHAVDTKRDLAIRLGILYGMRDDVQVAGDKDGPIAVIGQIMLWPNVISLLFFATPRFPGIVVPVTRLYRKMFDRMEAVGVHRIQAVSLAGYTQTHKFLGLFGLEREGPPMKAYGKNGEDFVQFARVCDVRSPGA